MKNAAIILFLIAILTVGRNAAAKICPWCGIEHETNKEETKEKKEEDAETFATSQVTRARFSAPSIAIADAADEILDRLEERYGKPKTWTSFPIYFTPYTGNGVAGYTLYSGGIVARVVCHEDLATAKGGTLDHELTHAFFFYFLNSNFDLFLNEGIAQNSEYRRRESLRNTIYKRYNAGEFWELSTLYGRNSYDGGLRIYHEGFSVVDYLIARGGSRWFACFMVELVKRDDVDEALNRFYGYENLQELQTEWKRYIEQGQNRETVRAIR